MKRFIVVVAVLALLALGSTAALAAPSSEGKACTTIQSGELFAANGAPLSVGFDKWGYNYQAHMFNGLADNYTRPSTPITEGDVYLEMKWSDDWISNKDCNGDGKLDRGGDSRISKGWVTNHYRWNYVDDRGKTQTATEFIKIVWVGPGGSLWGQYEVIQDVLNDPSGGYHGSLFKPASPGLGLNDHWTQQ